VIVYYTAKIHPLQFLSALQRVQPELSEKALADCNRYCKVDSGRLRASSKAASDMRRGRLIWKSEYARSAYYTEGASKDKNPLASKMWAHKAALLCNKKWRDFAAARLNQILLSEGHSSFRQKSVVYLPNGANEEVK
jgi:hypothetical protein